MSRKHFRLFAEMIHRHLRSLDEEVERVQRLTVASLARDMATIFKAENASFRYDKFFEACGLNEWGELK